MDSKTKRLGIFVCLGIVLVIAIAVALTNYRALFKPAVNEGQETLATEETMKIGADGKVQGADLDAFLKDDTFFDHENQFSEYQTTGEIETQSKDIAKEPVYMLVTSVAKDIRVTVVDEAGSTIVGEKFKVLLDDEDSFEDVDEDGRIQISDIRPGEYQVRLQDTDIYQAPKEPVKITVNESISYTPIMDISYMIKTEDEIDAKLEDTEQEDIGSEDTDATEYKDLFDSNETIHMGIDVSKWNGNIDWNAVKEAGIEYAIIRCGYRGSSTGALVEDPYFKQNMKNAKAAGIKVGIYFFTQATNEVEAVEEASMALALLDGANLDYPIFIDTEGAGGNGRADGLDVETRTVVCDAFCRTVKNEGYTAGIYASRNWYYKKLTMDTLNNYYIWLAEYRETPLYEGHYEMWQYTSSGHVNGITTRVDLDISYRSN